MKESLDDFLADATGNGPDGWPPGSEPSEDSNAEPDEAAPLAIPLGDIAPPAEDSGNTLLGNRCLCRQKSLLFVGPTGIGKSVAAVQSAILWSLGRPAFGIRAAAPLKSLIVQAENDAGDLCEMRDGIFRGLDMSAAEATAAGQAVLVVHEDEAKGFNFIQRLDKLLDLHRPDLLWLDPLFAYIGGNLADQENITTFCRAWLAPLLRRHNCGNVNLHHVNKPAAGKDKADWKSGDMAYLGSGHSELANWHRAVLAIRNVGSHDVFELVAGKRGKRLGWADADGNPVFARHIAHGRTGICWRDADPEEVPATATAKQGRAKTFLDLLALVPLPPARIEKDALTAAAIAGKIGRANAREFITQGITEGRLQETKEPRPGVRAAIYIARV